VVDDVYLTAADGPMLPNLRLTGAWPWIVAALGAVIVVVGGVLLSPGPQDQPAPPASTNWSHP